MIAQRLGTLERETNGKTSNQRMAAENDQSVQLERGTSVSGLMERSMRVATVDVFQVENAWSNSHVLHWLLDKEFKPFLHAFQNAGINGPMLLKLTKEELDKMIADTASLPACSELHKKSLLEAISKLKVNENPDQGRMEVQEQQPRTQADYAQPPTLKQWRNVVRTNALCHKFLTRRYHDRSMYLTVALVTLNAVCGSAIFTSASAPGDRPAEGFAVTSPQTILAFSAGFLAMLTAIISAIKSALGWDVRAEQHRQAALRYSKLWTRFDDIYGLIRLPYLEGYQKKHPLWLDWYKDYLDVMEFAPFVTDSIWDRFHGGSSAEPPGETPNRRPDLFRAMSVSSMPPRRRPDNRIVPSASHGTSVVNMAE